MLALSAGNAFRIAAQLLLFPLLARALAPAEFGLVALAMPVVLVAMLLADGGMGPAAVRARHPLHRVEATLFWAALACGAGLALLLAAAAPILARALSHPELAAVLRGLAPSLVLAALCAVPSVRVMRAGATWIFGVGEVAATLAGGAAALHLAWQGWGAWSLVAQQLAFWGAKAAVLLALAGAVPRARPGRAALRRLLREGVPTLGSNLLALATRTLDAVLVGWALGVQRLGHYTLAAQIARIPESVLVGPVFVSFLPAIARQGADGAAAARLFAATVRMMLTLVAPLMLGLAVVADLVVAILLGPRWGESAPVLALLAPAAIPQALGWLAMAVLVGRGRARAQFRLSLLATGLALGGLLAGLPWGLPGVAAGLALAAFGAGAAGVAAAAAELRLRAGALLSAAWPPMVAALLMAGAVAALRAALPPGFGAMLSLACAVGTGAVAYGAALLALGRRGLAEDLARFRRRA